MNNEALDQNDPVLNCQQGACMQFRGVGNNIQVIAYRGYDRNKKRAIAKMLGSFNKRTCILTDNLIDNLNQKEKIEVMLYVENMRYHQMMHLTQCQIKMSNIFIKGLADLYHSMFIETDEHQSCFRINSYQATE